MIDTHSHINMIEGLPLGDIIKEAKDNGVEKIILPSASLSDIDAVYEIVKKYDNRYSHTVDKISKVLGSKSIF